MRVLVCGGRNFNDKATLYKVLGKIHLDGTISCIIHGGADGADTLAGEWALDNTVSVERYDAEWDKYGRAAGPLRNSRMLREGRPDLVVAFPGGRGTENMKQQARNAFVKVEEIK